MSVRGWTSDVAVGVRLAVGGGRTSLVRLALSSVGIAIAVAVLLVGASVGTMSENRDLRQNAGWPYPDEQAGVSPTYHAMVTTPFRDELVRINYVRVTAPDSPKPAGLPELPKPGEMYASPALIDLLRSDEGELLRPRLPDRIVGTLDKNLVVMPGDLVAWTGADETLSESDLAERVYVFGRPQPTEPFDPNLLMLVLIGTVVVLLPVFVFVSSASRIAGAERDRRLSALRLVGGGARQVRRIAAAESLVSAVIGLALGAAVFLTGRLFAEDVDLFGQRVYVSDVVPNPVMVVLVVLLIPAVSVLTAMVALRRTIIEPLGVVRQAKPVRRRATWRFALVVLGVVMLTTQLGTAEGTDLWAFVVIGGAVLLLIGVPVLLPWLVERVVGRVRGGPSSWLLAIRRLQLDSGTSARVVGGVAVVLAGTITLQAMLLSLDGPEAGLSLESGEVRDTVEVSTTSELGPDVLRRVERADGVLVAHVVQHFAAYRAGSDDRTFSVAMLSCAALRDLGGVRDCRDGDTFANRTDHLTPPAPETPLEFREYSDDASDYEVTGGFTVPATVKDASPKAGSPLHSDMFLTPGALAGQPVGELFTNVVAQVTADLMADQMERIRNTVADHRWQSYVFSHDAAADVDQGTYVTVRNALYAGSLFTLTLAGISMLVLALEHIRERRRPLAILAASGVPRGVLGRSLLWQIALPITLGVAVALATGIGLAALIMRLTGEPLTVDWSGVTLLCAGAIALTVLVTALTLPFLRSATRLTALRTE